MILATLAAAAFQAAVPVGVGAREYRFGVYRPSVPKGSVRFNVHDYGEARYFGHLAYEVDDISGLCEKLMKAGVTINRPPRDGVMAFVRSPDKHSIELLQKGNPLPPKEPWASMSNTGKW